MKVWIAIPKNHLPEEAMVLVYQHEKDARRFVEAENAAAGQEVWLLMSRYPFGELAA